MSTKVALGHILKPDENPYEFRLPSPPKTRSLVLKNGTAKNSSKLMQWMAQTHQPETPIDKTNVALCLDSSGNALVEWTFHNAEPISEHHTNPKAEANTAAIQDLELKYSFYTFSKKRL